MDEGTLRALGDEIAKTLAGIDRAEYRLMALLRDFDKAEGWHSDGHPSLVSWLSWRCGLSQRAARERVRVALALPDLPAADAAFADGAISYSKARALTRVATPENETTLVSCAQGMTAHELEKLCRMMRPAASGSADAEPQRSFSQRTDAAGMVRMTITVTADEAAHVCAVLDSHAPAPNRRAEGLVALADERSRGTAPDGKPIDRNPTEVVMHICADDLSGATDDGRGLSAETSRRLLCDAGVVPTLCDETGKTLDVGRKTRTIPTSIRRALSMRDDGCRFPGCNHIIVDGHHIDHWCNGGETKLDNLVSLCRWHHRLLHEGGASVEVTPDGTFTFRNARGDELKAVPRPEKPLHVAIDSHDSWRAVATDSFRPIDWESVTCAVLG